jgi:predicted RNA-binding protein
MRDVIYAKKEENKVIVKDILGKTMEFVDCKIIEVDVSNARLILVRA